MSSDAQKKMSEITEFEELYPFAGEQVRRLDGAESSGELHPYELMKAKINLLLSLQGATLRILAEKNKVKLVIPQGKLNG